MTKFSAPKSEWVWKNIGDDVVDHAGTFNFLTKGIPNYIGKVNCICNIPQSFTWSRLRSCLVHKKSRVKHFKFRNVRSDDENAMVSALTTVLLDSCQNILDLLIMKYIGISWLLLLQYTMYPCIRYPVYGSLRMQILGVCFLTGRKAISC